MIIPVRMYVLLTGLSAVSAYAAQLDANAIIQHSVEVLRADWNAAPEYDYSERDVDDQGTMTYRVLMIGGSPYRRLVSINGAKLSGAEEKKAQHKLDRVMAERRGESKEKTGKRVAEYRQDRHRDHRLMEELAKAFIFKLSDKPDGDSGKNYILDATPLPGYRPPDKETQVLTGMKGTLWIDKATFQWVKAEAEVVHPVSIVGFLATVEPGTSFELDKGPVADGVWLPTHLTIRSKARILGFFGRCSRDDQTYFDYHKSSDQGAPLSSR